MAMKSEIASAPDAISDFLAICADPADRHGRKSSTNLSLTGHKGGIDHRRRSVNRPGSSSRSWSSGNRFCRQLRGRVLRPGAGGRQQNCAAKAEDLHRRLRLLSGAGDSSALQGPSPTPRVRRLDDPGRQVNRPAATL